MLAGGITVLFIASIVILLKVIPGPHSKTDYLVIGAVATFLSMTLLFVTLLNSGVPGAEKRPLPPEESGDS